MPSKSGAKDRVLVLENSNDDGQQIDIIHTFCLKAQQLISTYISTNYVYFLFISSEKISRSRIDIYQFINQPDSIVFEKKECLKALFFQKEKSTFVALW